MKRETQIKRNAAAPTANRATLQRKCAGGRHSNSDSQCSESNNKQSTLQRSTEQAPSVVQQALQSPGQPLDSASRAFMEPRFGQDFSEVRVHTDNKASESASAVNALAYTIGHDLVFGTGKYAPQSDSGKHLLAHELAHVVQQDSGQVGTDAEFRAENSADLVTRGQPVKPETKGHPKTTLQKKDGKDDPVATPDSKNKSSPAAAAPNETTEPPIDGFDFDKSTIPPQHLERLAALRTKLISAPAAAVTLIGHTDTVGNEKYNEGLGMRRAAAVRDFLTGKNGIDSSRVKTQTMGERQPAAGQPPAKPDPDKGENNPKNRRVDIQITGLSAPSAPAPAKGWSLDPSGPPIKQKPWNLNLRPDFLVPPGTTPDKPSGGPLRPTPTTLPPDFFKPLPPPIPGTEPKSLSDILSEKVLNPIVDTVTKPLHLSKERRDQLKEWVRKGVIAGSAKAARSLAEAAGEKDPQVLDAIEKATEAALQQKVTTQP